MTKETKVFIGIVFGLVVTITGLFIFNANTPGKYDEFAQCINNSGATFFGTFWCPHCQQQKLLFGKSEKYLPYKECSTPNGHDFNLCANDNIESTPTWQFADGTRVTGVQSLESLATVTNCKLPQ